MDSERGRQLATAVIIQNTPLITCPMPSDRRTITNYGVADYLVKPVSRQALHDTVQRLPQPVQKILVIDDDRDIVRMFTRMLQTAPHRYTVLQSYSGTEGLGLMKSKRPDAVILDVLMEGMDGFAVLQQMQSDPSLAKIPVILTSAKGAIDSISPSVRGELCVHKQQGFQPAELIQCVEALVDVLTPANVPSL
ncbi:MAG: response regulator [Anaerolineae bacterium]|nr:response regulator [Anaerolineae bacterium]